MQTLVRALYDSGRIPTLIEVDVEGYEGEVLHDARAVLAASDLNAAGSSSQFGRPDAAIVDMWMRAQGDCIGRR